MGSKTSRNMLQPTYLMILTILMPMMNAYLQSEAEISCNKCVNRYLWSVLRVKLLQNLGHKN